MSGAKPICLHVCKIRLFTVTFSCVWEYGDCPPWCDGVQRAWNGGLDHTCTLPLGCLASTGKPSLTPDSRCPGLTPHGTPLMPQLTSTYLRWFSQCHFPCLILCYPQMVAAVAAQGGLVVPEQGLRGHYIHILFLWTCLHSLRCHMFFVLACVINYQASTVCTRGLGTRLAPTPPLSRHPLEVCSARKQTNGSLKGGSQPVLCWFCQPVAPWATATGADPQSTHGSNDS